MKKIMLLTVIASSYVTASSINPNSKESVYPNEPPEINISTIYLNGEINQNILFDAYRSGENYYQGDAKKQLYVNRDVILRQMTKCVAAANELGFEQGFAKGSAVFQSEDSATARELKMKFLQTDQVATERHIEIERLKTIITDHQQTFTESLQKVNAEKVEAQGLLKIANADLETVSKELAALHSAATKFKKEKKSLEDQLTNLDQQVTDLNKQVANLNLNQQKDSTWLSYTWARFLVLHKVKKLFIFALLSLTLVSSVYGFCSLYKNLH
jgi:hypothetical protein